MAPASSERSWGFDRLSFRAAPARSSATRSAPRRHRVRRSLSRVLGSEPCSEDTSRRRSFAEFEPEAGKSRASPALPGCGRVPRSSASSSVSMHLQPAGRAAQPAQRMFEQREQGRRLELPRHRFRDQPRENAGGRLNQRVAAGIVEVEIPAPQRRHYPPRQRAVRRHQRCRFFEMPRLAHRHRDRQRLHLGIGAPRSPRDLSCRRNPAAIRARRSRRCHCAVAFDGRIASETSTSRPCAVGRRGSRRRSA